MIRRFAALNVSCVSRLRWKINGCLCAYLAVFLDKPPVSLDANKAGGRVPLLRVNSAGGGVGCGNGNESLLDGHESDFSGYSAVAAAHETAGESKRIAGFPKEHEPESSKNVGSAAVHAGGGVGCGSGNVDLLEVPSSDVFGNSAVAAAPETAAHATASESKRILGLREKKDKKDHQAVGKEELEHVRHNSDLCLSGLQMRRAYCAGRSGDWECWNRRLCPFHAYRCSSFLRRCFDSRGTLLSSKLFCMFTHHKIFFHFELVNIFHDSIFLNSHTSLNLIDSLIHRRDLSSFFIIGGHLHCLRCENTSSNSCIFCDSTIIRIIRGGVQPPFQKSEIHLPLTE